MKRTRGVELGLLGLWRRRKVEEEEGEIWVCGVGREEDEEEEGGGERGEKEG